MQTLLLNEDRFFSPVPEVRKLARELYESVKNFPIVSPHGHVDPAIFSENKPFPDPARLFLLPDHYLYRMLYSQGIPMESLGILDKEGRGEETDARKIWRLFASKYHLFRGTPSRAWLDYEFHIVFGIDERLSAESADRIYDELQEKINSSEFLPRALFEKFNIEALNTTDAASDNLIHHIQMRKDGWEGKVLPCFRPDAVTDLTNPSWYANIKLLGESAGMEITGYKTYIHALEKRREFFISMGAVSTDHGVFSPYTHRLTDEEAVTLFHRALKGEQTTQDASLFTAHMLMEMARMSCEDGMVMQIHAGAYRNHNELIYAKFGPDKGCDIPRQTEYTENLKELLNTYGNDSRFTLIVFTLDETNYARELAPLAGHYPAMKLGPAWWFHDSIEGMTRYRQMVTETAGFYNTVGFNDDTRAFVSIPARHDLARRVDSNFLAELTAKHIIERNEAFELAADLTYNLVKKAYKL